ncbi:prolipoprotein diacylglyceryl transferase [Brachyspira hampsonii]|uniref:prolipoprotein diacylglyceryl transferase n=1 Tax=Brachyspira hampsonii TaxID=1287055 RepID=UPI001CA48C46|nr:prolipoprotein diacylglyceryl transferase [Brachyspira hampsonii]MBW5390354.1 prolipoprotein diacylglyceryl transferase [Brachyspira hampsonii]
MTYPEFFTPYVFPPNIPILGAVRWYGLMYIVGILVSCIILYFVQKRGWIKLNLNEKNGGIYDMVFYAAVGAIVGARIGYFLFYSPQSFLTPWEIIGINLDNGFSFTGFAGMSFHGGLIGMFIAEFIFSKRYKYDFYTIADNATLPSSFCLFFGRIGNFMNAELYGRVTDSFLGMKFPLYDAVGGYERWVAMFPAIRPYTEPRHPSQLYEAFLEGLVLAFVSFLIAYLSEKNKKIRPGTRLWVWILLYGLFRTLIEQFARDITEWTLGPITAGAIYSIVMFIIALIMLIYIYSKKDNNTALEVNTKEAKKNKKK